MYAGGLPPSGNPTSTSVAIAPNIRSRSRSGTTAPWHARFTGLFRRDTKNHLLSSSALPLATASATVAAGTGIGGSSVSKGELGRATWLFLHMVAAQFPDKPTRKQQQDAKDLIHILTRLYPCADCAEHWQKLVRDHPPVVSSGPAFRQWMCEAHNIVNRSLGKPTFNCDFVEARWGSLDCEGSLCTIKGR